MRVMIVAVLFVFSIFGAQLLRVQGFDAASTAASALSERTQTEEIPALRGRILDVNGKVLAASLERRQVVADQTAVPEYQKTVGGVRTKVGVPGAVADLAPLLDLSPDTLAPMLTGKARYRILAKNVTPLTWRKISELGIPGIYSERTTSTRSYPQPMDAASLVGFMQASGAPGGGLEVMLDTTLKGKAGHEAVETAPNGRVIPSGRQEVTPAIPGHDVKLSINSDLQWYAQNALAQKVIETQALSGSVVVQSVKTGKLLAVASYPTFDSNNAARAAGRLTNLAFNDVYEPGSTAKVMTAAAALQEGVVTPATPVVVPNTIHRSDRTFHDSHDHPTEYLTFSGVLAQSSNIGTMLAGERVRPQRLESYFRKFGVGSASGMGFPGESAGLFAPYAKWSGSQRYTVMFGQGLSVTAIQAAGVYQTIANNGVRIPPRIVDSVADDQGIFQPAQQAAGVRVVSPAVAQELRRMLEGVVSSEGTAPQAKVAGYRIAGKTGTADRYDARVGGYSGKTASFIGFAPADDPEIVVAVTLQRPVKGYYGGIVAAPVFRDVMTYALQALQIPPTSGKPTKVTLKLDSAPAASDPKVIRDRHGGQGG
ncbi:MAG TPA: penicillin-binding protein 2 [Dermatophilaceae bacterium]|nr:penicillin-binding protein 2 [Dermatophilaceae bacterium]